MLLISTLNRFLSIACQHDAHGLPISWSAMCNLLERSIKKADSDALQHQQSALKIKLIDIMFLFQREIESFHDTASLSERLVYLSPFYYASSPGAESIDNNRWLAALPPSRLPGTKEYG